MENLENQNSELQPQQTEIPDSVNEFCCNYTNKNGKDAQMANVYLLQTVNRDGEVTGEAYGMNLLTDLGLSTFYVATVSVSKKTLHIGYTTQTPTYSNNTMYGLIATSGYFDNSGSSVAFPMTTYNPDTGVISNRSYIGQFYFDYNISGITEPKEINEIGYTWDSTSASALHAHTRVYDKDGNLTSITKNINERLYISLYWTSNMHKSIMQNAYDLGRYFLINSMNFLKKDPQIHNMLSPRLYVYLKNRYKTYYSNDGNFSLNIYSSDGTIVNRVKTQPVTLLSSLIMTGTRDYFSDFFVCVSSYYSDYGYFSLVLTKDRLTNPETLESNMVYTDDWESDLLSNTFGLEYNSYTKQGELPCVDFNMTSSKLYNHLTKEWEDEDFINNADFEYDSDVMKYPFAMRINWDGSNQLVSVYVNTRTDLPITYFSNSNITLYATDEYWDTSTWVLIPSISNVPETLRNKRYYVKTAGFASSLSSNYLYPYRDTVRHAIIPETPDFPITLSSKNIGYWSSYETTPVLFSDDYNWILFHYIQNNYYYILLFPESDKSYTLYGVNNTTSTTTDCCYQTGDRIIIGSTSQSGNYNKIRIYTIIDADTTPTFVDLTLDFTTPMTSQIPSTNFSITNNRYMCIMSNNSTNEAIVLDLYGGEDGITPTQYKLQNVGQIQTQPLTNYCIYRDVTLTDGTIVMVVYDMENQEIVSTFNIPNDELNITLAGICGFREFVYVRVYNTSSYSTYLYNIENDSLQYFPTMNINGMSGYTFWRTESLCNECMLLWNGASESMSGIGLYLISATDPTNPVLIMQTFYGQTFSNIRGMHKLKYCRDNKSLLFFCHPYSYSFATQNRSRFCVIDIGHYLDTGTALINGNVSCNSLSTGSIADRQFAAVVPYKDWLVAYSIESNKFVIGKVERMMNHKVTGTTRTIQSYNNPKDIKNKTITYQITNDISNFTPPT